MIYLSQKGHPYWYKVRGVKKGVSAKNVPYTFIKISAKDMKTEQYHNCTLTAWEDIDVAEGDKVAIYGIDKADFSITESGFKTFTELLLGVTDIKVKPAEKEPETQTTKTEEKQTQKPTESRVPINEQLFGGEDDGDIPF